MQGQTHAGTRHGSLVEAMRARRAGHEPEILPRRAPSVVPTDYWSQILDVIDELEAMQAEFWDRERDEVRAGLGDLADALRKIPGVPNEEARRKWKHDDDRRKRY